MDVRILEGTDMEHKFDPDEVVFIDKNDIDGEFLRQASKYVWYSILYAKAVAKRERLKFDMDVIEVGLDADIRKDTQASGVKITEKAISAQITGMLQYKKAMENYQQAKEDGDILASVCRALEQRKDMLVSYGSLLKSEYGAQILAKTKSDSPPVKKKTVKKKLFSKDKK